MYWYIFTAYDNALTLNAVNNMRFILKNVNSNMHNFYSQTDINTEVVCLFIYISKNYNKLTKFYDTKLNSVLYYVNI